MYMSFSCLMLRFGDSVSSLETGVWTLQCTALESAHAAQHTHPATGDPHPPFNGAQNNDEPPSRLRPCLAATMCAARHAETGPAHGAVMRTLQANGEGPSAKPPPHATVTARHALDTRHIDMAGNS